MAENESTVFGRMRALRSRVERLLPEVRRLAEQIPDAGDDPHGWNPARDLRIQLGDAEETLLAAIDELRPTDGHIDAALVEVSRV